MKIPKTPQEVELWYIMPAIKREMAKILNDKGYKQNNIASVLGTTKSAISQYFSGNRAKEFEFGNEIMIEIKKGVDEIIKGSNVNMEIQKIVKIVRQEGKICEFLKKNSNCVPEGCKICMG